MKPLAFLVASLLLAAGPASATLVKYRFSGVLDDAGGTGYTQFSGELSYDDAAADTLPGNDMFGVYDYNGEPWGLSVSFDGGADARRYTSLSVQLGNEVGANGKDQFAATALSGADLIGLYFEDPSGGLLAGDWLGGLPAVQLDALGGDSAQRRFYLVDQVPGATALYRSGRVLSLDCEAGCATTASVPEPSTPALAGVGLLGLAWLRRRANPGGGR